MVSETDFNPVIARFQTFVETLGVTRYRMALDMDMKPNALNRFLKSKHGFSQQALAAICRSYPLLSIEWLLTGRGLMMRTEDEMRTAQESTPIYHSGKNNRLVSKYQYAEYARNYANDQYIATLPHLALISAQGKFRHFEVSGNSMLRADKAGLMDGDIITAQFVDPEVYTRALVPGIMCVFIIEGDVLIRTIGTGGKNLKLVAFNPIFLDIKLEFTDIKECWAYHSLSTSRPISSVNL